MLNLSRCEHIIKNDAVDDIYKKIRHVLISRVDVQQICQTENTKEAKIQMYCKVHNQEDSLFPLDFPLHRSYHGNISLKNRELIGKIAKQELFLLKSIYRRNGLAKRIYSRELKAYKEAEINQVWLDAAADGIMTWSRSPFNFNIIEEGDERDIVLLWREYVNEVFIFSNEKEFLDTIKNKRSVRSLPKEYVVPDNKQSFADWYKDRRPAKLVSMYKDIDGFSIDENVEEEE